jgi:TM2 domain-containing membrane protein YozV
MEAERSPRSNVNPAVAAFLSALFPGLGQFYNGQWAKGAAFFFVALLLVGALLSSVDVDRFERSLLADEVPSNLGLLLVLTASLVLLALWSIVDAAHMARRTR